MTPARVCACARCRGERREAVVGYLASLDARLARILPPELLAWLPAAEHVGAAEARLGGLLLAAEMSGEPWAGLRAEIEAAERALWESWSAAGRAFDLFAGPGAR